MQKYIVKNIHTDEIVELNIDTQFIQDILEVGKIYIYETNCYIKATQEEVDNYNIQKNNNVLVSLKKAKNVEFEANYDKSKLDMIITQNKSSDLTYLSLNILNSGTSHGCSYSFTVVVLLDAFAAIICAYISLA